MIQQSHSWVYIQTKLSFKNVSVKYKKEFLNIFQNPLFEHCCPFPYKTYSVKKPGRAPHLFITFLNSQQRSGKE